MMQSHMSTVSDKLKCRFFWTGILFSAAYYKPRWPCF